jgi:L-asparaginase
METHMLPRIAFIGTGGTIASRGTDPFDLLDYNATGERVDARTLIAQTGLGGTIADILPVDFRRIDSTAITHEDWADLIDICHDLSKDAALDGIVIGHGTASLEETAWMLSLVLDLDIQVIVTGAMRPLSGISSDASANLAAAIRVAAACRRRRRGGRECGPVLVVLNDEIHAPRLVTKSHTLRVNAFTSPWSGPLGFVDGPVADIVRVQRSVHAASFSPDLVRNLPRVDIAYSHIGAGGTAIRAFVEAGAKGIVSAGFAPGMGTPAEIEALGEAIAAGVTVVQSSRTGAGRVVDGVGNRSIGIIAGNDLNPQKARILLALCLARGDSHARITDIFQSA